MVSKKRFSNVDGVTSRFLSDFIIQSEQFARVYNYFYNPAGVEGDIDPGTGLATRVLDFPDPAEDLVTLDKWDLVDNSILFYTEPVVGSSVYIEVATTPEEFGDTLTAPAVERAETAADEAEASAAAALVSETNAATSEANALVSETNAAADALSANTDRLAVDARLDTVQANSNTVEQNLDVVTSDPVATQLANAETNATNAEASAAAALVSETNAALSAAEAASYVGLPATVVPTLSAPTTTPNESTILTVTKSNYSLYSSEAVWTVVIDAGSYVDNGATIDWTIPDYTGVDDEHNMVVTVNEPSHATADSLPLTITVQEVVGGVPDDTVIYEGATMTTVTFPTRTNVDVIANVLTATADGGTAESLVYEQEGGDTDFFSATPTTDSKAVNFTIDSATNIEATVSGTKLEANGSLNTSITDAVPTMTSNTAPSGVASASAEDVASEAFRAFDGIESGNNAWFISGQSTNTWIQYQFTAPIIINKFTILPYDNAVGFEGAPSELNFYGSTTGAFAGEEVLLKNQSGIVYANQTDLKTITFRNNAEYTYYRLEVVATQNSYPNTAIGELKFIEAQEVPIHLIDGDAILLNDGATTTLQSFDTTGKVTQELWGVTVDPTTQRQDNHTTYVASTGTASAISESGGWGAYNAFDNNIMSTAWLKATAFAVGDYVDYIFTTPRRVKSIDLGWGTYDGIKTIEVQYTTDGGSTWTTDHTFSQTSVAGVTYNTVFTNSNLFIEGIRLRFTAYVGSSVTTLWLCNINTEIDPLSSTIDLTIAGLTSAPTTIAKDVPSLETSMVTTGGADSFQARTAQSYTADADGSVVANDEFETVLWTGNATIRDITMTNISGTVDFGWVKSRGSVGNHALFDSVRGATKYLQSSTTNAEATQADTLTSFNTGSVSLGADATAGNVNFNSVTYVGWFASLPNHTPSNTDGTITSVTKNNSFMSAVSYTGNGINGATIGHSLGVAPELIIEKDRDAGTFDWIVQVPNELTAPTYSLFLSTNSAENPASSVAAPTASVFTPSITAYANVSGNKNIAYCFASVAGKCKVGSYTGDGLDNTQQIECGFEPAFVLVKGTGHVTNWNMYDNQRDPNILRPNLSDAEFAPTVEQCYFNETGFRLGTSTDINQSTSPYIYLAIGKEVANTATEITTLFDADTRSNTRDLKHKVTFAESGEEVSRIQSEIEKLA